MYNHISHSDRGIISPHSFFQDKWLSLLLAFLGDRFPGRGDLDRILAWVGVQMGPHGTWLAVTWADLGILATYINQHRRLHVRPFPQAGWVGTNQPATTSEGVTTATGMSVQDGSPES